MWLSGGESSSRAIESQNFTCQRTTASEISPRRHCSSTSTSIVFKEVSKGKHKADNFARHPATSLLLLLPHLSSSSILVAPRFTTHKSERSDLPTSKAPIPKRYVPNYHMLHLFRSHGKAPSSLLHPTLLRLCPRAPSLFSLSFSLYYHYHIPRNYLSFI